MWSSSVAIPFFSLEWPGLYKSSVFQLLVHENNFVRPPCCGAVASRGSGGMFGSSILAFFTLFMSPCCVVLARVCVFSSYLFSHTWFSSVFSPLFSFLATLLSCVFFSLGYHFALSSESFQNLLSLNDCLWETFQSPCFVYSLLLCALYSWREVRKNGTETFFPSSFYLTSIWKAALCKTLFQVLGYLHKQNTLVLSWWDKEIVYLFIIHLFIPSFNKYFFFFFLKYISWNNLNKSCRLQNFLFRSDFYFYFFQFTYFKFEG